MVSLLNQDLKPTELNNPADPSASKIPYQPNDEVVWTQVHESQGCVWIASNPWTLFQERCSDHEYWIIQSLTNPLTQNELIARFHQKFHPLTMNSNQLNSLLKKGLEHRLLVSLEAPSQVLAKPSYTQSANRRQDLETRTNPEGPSTSILSVWAALVLKMFQSRLSFGSPQEYLVWLRPIANLVFGRIGLINLFVLIAVALCLAATRWTELLSELPDWRSLRSPQVWLGFSILFFVTRAIHELGHALACLKHNVRIVDCGLVSSFGMMCPYVDVTQSWRCDRPQQRIAIATGGIVAELWIAGIAAIIWGFTQDGWVHDFAFRTMLLCSLVTLLFNANPLMKYDGYYVLSDWVGIQNLRDRSWQALDSMFGGKSTEPAWRTLWLSVYCLASIANRTAITLAIATFAYWIASQWRIAMVGILVCSLYIFSLLIVAWDRRRSRRVIVSPQHGLLFRGVGWTSIVCLLLISISMPLPSRVYSKGKIQLGESVPIYASEGGTLRFSNAAPKDMSFARGELLLKIENQEIELGLQDREEKLILAKHGLEAKNRQAFSDSLYLEEIPWLTSQVHWLEKQVEELSSRKLKLSVHSPVQGIFTPALSSIKNDNIDSIRDRETTSNSRLSKHFQPGEFVRKGDLLGWLKPISEPIAICEFSEEDIAKVRIGNSAKLRATRFPNHIFEATVVDISNSSVHGSRSKSEKPYQVRFQLARKSIGSRIAYLLDGSSVDLVAHCSDRTLLDDALDLVFRNFKVR